MGRHTGFQVAASVAAATLFLKCSEFESPAVAGGGSFATSGVSFTTGVGIGGGTPSTPDPGQVTIEAVLDRPSTGGAAGMTGFAGAAGGAGESHSSSEAGTATSGPRPLPEGVPLAGIWDDHLNQQSFLAKLSELLLAPSPGALGLDRTDHEAASQLARQRTRTHEQLEIALVLDTTGSMADELEYLQTKLDALWQAIDARYPTANQRWASIAYRDQGDNYVTLTREFTDSREQYLDELNRLVAEGGGDIPEATERALHELNALDWDTDDATSRLAFWFTDAPHHNDSAALVQAELLEAQSRGIAIYPVASANTDPATMWHLRVAAQLTGGRYMFQVTPVGLAPSASTLPPCFFVSELFYAMQRVVQVEMDGHYVAPAHDTLVGTHGYPMDGVCHLVTGSVTAF